MGDLVKKINDMLRVANTEERGAYSLGLSHAYGEVFEAIYSAPDVANIRARIHEQWDQAVAAQQSQGML